MRLFCFNPRIPRINNVMMYVYDGMVIVLGMSSISLGSRMNDARNLPAWELFCFSSNHFGYGRYTMPYTTHFSRNPSLKSINVVPINSLLNWSLS